jgi:hypothetical protein
MVSSQQEEPGARIQVLGGGGVDQRRACRGAALDRAQRPRDIRFGAWMTANLFKQAAPRNVSTRVRLVGTLRRRHHPKPER